MLKKCLSLIIVFVLLALPTSGALAEKPVDDGQKGRPADVGHKGKPPELNPKGNQYGLTGKGSDINTTTLKGFDKYGYNRNARIFNGTGLSWCMGKLGYDEAGCREYLGANADDKLVMKWNAEWDRGNSEGWSDSHYAAWENNEWNGKVPGGSGSVWHYKIVWVGNCVSKPALVPEGGACIWGQFAVIMDQGTDSGGHLVISHAIPNGYGAYR